MNNNKLKPTKTTTKSNKPSNEVPEQATGHPIFIKRIGLKNFYTNQSIKNTDNCCLKGPFYK